MKLSACDIGNSIYEKSPSETIKDSQIEVEFWFNCGDHSEIKTVELQHKATIAGIFVYASVPDFSEYILWPDDAKEDITQAIYLELGMDVCEINWL